MEYSHLQQTKKMGATIWSPLDSGMLTGKYNDDIPKDSRYATNTKRFAQTVKELSTPESQAKIKKIRTLTALARLEFGCTMSQLARAWVVKNPNVSTCSLGASKQEQIVDNLKALDVISKLTPEIMHKIDNILENKPTQAPQFGREQLQL